MANGYDEEALHKDAVGDFANFVLSHVALATGRDVIDVACGTGLLADAIRPPRHPTLPGSLTGIDLSEEMARLAAPRYDRMFTGDAVHILTGIPGAADVILCAGATYYFHDIAPFLRAAATALKGGGDLVFSEFAAPEGAGVMTTIGGTRRHCRAPDLLRRLCAEAGLVERSWEYALYYGLPARYWHFQKPA